MSNEKMHADQLATDADLVRRLLRSQFPDWAGLAVEPIASDGTSNAIFRLGEQLAVRLPLQPGNGEQLAKEHRWLPAFAPVLPLSIPVPVAKGEPDEGFPCAWTVCEWLEGENPTLGRLADPRKAATALARFIVALQEIDPSSGPAPGEHNFFRGLPLASRDARTRESIEGLAELIDADAVSSAWERDLSAPAWDRPPVWVHGDLAPGNLLAHEGELTSVIDWGGLGVGDPAIELLPAWNLFEGRSRQAFREALEVDEATWARGRGLALSQGLIALVYYIDSNPAIARWSRRLIDVVLEDHERSP